MFLKKFNAVIAILTTALLVIHSTITSLTTLLGLSGKPPVVLMCLFTALLVIHIIASLLMLAFSEHYKIKLYPNVEKSWLLQRVTGMSIIPITIIHILGFNGTIIGGWILPFIMHLFIMITAYIHVSVSFPNALITLGFSITSKRHKAIRKICSFICVILLFLGLAASISEVIKLL